MRKYWIFVTALVAAACVKMEMEAPVMQEQKGETWTVTADAFRDTDTDSDPDAESSTKVLDNSVESHIFFYWGGKDQVEMRSVYQEATVGILTPRHVGGSSTQLHGNMYLANPRVGSEYTLHYPRVPVRPASELWQGQKGTIEDISENFHYASARVEVVTLNQLKSALQLSDAHFKNHQSITQFELSYPTENTEGIVKLTITAPGLEGPVTVVPATPGKKFLVAIPANALSENSDTRVPYTFLAQTESGKIFEGTRRASLKAGKYYKATVSGMSEYDPLRIPLTIEALYDGEVTVKNPLGRALYYGFAGVNQSRINSNVTSNSEIRIKVKAGDRLLLGGKFYNGVRAWSSSSERFNISCNVPFYAYGNVMSMIDFENYLCPGQTTYMDTMEEYALAGMFEENIHLYNHPEKTLELPAKTVKAGAYALMFFDCDNLTQAPELPATKLHGGPYTTMGAPWGPYYMTFSNCDRLKTAPSILPAMSVPKAAYFAMFRFCESLEASPVLPAPYPAPYAYRAMFSYCPSLRQITCYAVSGWGPQNATESWVENVPAGGVFIKDPGAGWPSGIHGIPEGWNSDAPTPLTVEAIEDGTLVISNPQGLSISWGESISQTSLSTSRFTTIYIPLVAGGKIYLWGDNAVYGGADGATYLNTTITSSAAHYVYGDIRSLLTKGDNTRITSISSWAFSGLFQGNTGLRSHPSQVLTMGTQAVGDYAFNNMFFGCTGLVRAPELPATTLGEECYGGMFSECTSLKEAPELPAENLSAACYSAMFSVCTSLVTAPALPATTLAEGCYGNMFDACTSLVNAPVLPASHLPEGCYSYMFRDCSSLKAVKCLATNPLLSDYSADPVKMGNVDDWLEGTSSTGTLTRKAGVNWPSGAVPSGWNVQNP